MSDGPNHPAALLRRMRRSARAGHAEQLLAVAVARGWLSPAQREELTGEEDPVGAAAARGWLTADDRAALERALAHADFARGVVAGAPPPEVTAALADPGRQLDDLVLIERLGAGGTAEVWKGWDRSLGRWVAVKRPRIVPDGDDELARLQREAQAAARLNHPNIVPLHRLGVHEGRPYLVMPLITGRTLAELSLPIRRAVEVVREAALALDHAHRAGLVHRDVKPSNLMLDDDGRVWLLDFGLAHLRDADPLGATRPGVALGTAAYMSPEQAAGDQRSRAPTTDVYGLGATLYHLVTGAPPFEGQSFGAVVARVMEGGTTPARQRRSEVSRDLDTVIETAMARDPSRRYATAAALAEDLGRVLEDRPIAARRTGLVVRAARRIRRHAAVSAVAVTLLVVAAGVAIVQTRLEAERAAALDTVRRLARASLESALRLRRAGDPGAPRRTLPELEAAYQIARARAGGLPEPDYLMGRLYRAVMDDDRALAHQDRALAMDASYAPALYERLVLLSRRHARTLARQINASRAGGGGARVAAVADPELERLRGEILRVGARLDGAALAEPQRLVVAGLLAQQRGRWADARAALERAAALDPGADEIWETLAAREEAAGRLAAAARIYTAALAGDRGYLPYLVGRCRARVETDQTAAIEDATAALAADPSLTDAWVCRGMGAMLRGNHTMHAGGDPAADFAAAERNLTEAVTRDASAWRALWARGTARRYRAQHRLRVGEDALPDLDGSERDLQEAIRLSARDAGLARSLGRTRATRALARMRAGQDPEADFAAARADLEAEAAEQDVTASEWLANLHAHRGAYLLSRGDDAGAAAAFAEGERAIARADTRRSRWVMNTRALLGIWGGRAARRAGADPSALWARAEDDLTAAINLGPDIGELHWRLAQLRLERGTPADLREVQPAIDRAMALAPRAPEPWIARAELLRRRGQRAEAAAAEARASALAPRRRFATPFVEP